MASFRFITWSTLFCRLLLAGLFLLPALTGGAVTFAYTNNGLLSSRSNFSRIYSVTGRDGRGRILTTSTAAGGVTPLGETLAWRNDGRVASYVAARGDFTDTHAYSYAALTQRLIQESLYVSGGVSVTENYTNDFGAPAGLGILTGAGQTGNGSWNVPGSGLDALGRLMGSTNSTITRTANGVCLGAEIITGALDGKPVNVEYGGTDSPGNWHTSLALTPARTRWSCPDTIPASRFSPRPTPRSPSPVTRSTWSPILSTATAM